MEQNKPEYLSPKVLDTLLNHLEKVIKLSLRYGLKTHSSVGGKYYYIEYGDKEFYERRTWAQKTELEENLLNNPEK